MTTVSSLMCSSDLWWGFTLAHDRARVEQLQRRMKRCGFLPPSAPTAEQLAASADAQLFKAIIPNPYHVLKRGEQVALWRVNTDSARCHFFLYFSLFLTHSTLVSKLFFLAAQGSGALLSSNLEGALYKS